MFEIWLEVVENNFFKVNIIYVVFRWMVYVFVILIMIFLDKYFE